MFSGQHEEFSAVSGSFLPCPFARAILSGHAQCAHSASFHIGERHGMQCTVENAQSHCAEFSDLLHQNSRFALGVIEIPEHRTANMELRIQCGGLSGLQHTFAESQNQTAQITNQLADIQALITQALEQFKTIARFPYGKITRSIASWKPRRRGRRNTKI